MQFYEKMTHMTITLSMVYALQGTFCLIQPTARFATPEEMELVSLPNLT